MKERKNKMSGWIASRSSKMIWTVGIYNGLKKIDNQIAREKAMKRGGWESSSSSKKEPYKSPKERRKEEMEELKEQIRDFLMDNEDKSFLGSEICEYLGNTSGKVIACYLELVKEGKITKITPEKGASRYQYKDC